MCGIKIDSAVVALLAASTMRSARRHHWVDRLDSHWTSKYVYAALLGVCVCAFCVCVLVHTNIEYARERVLPLISRDDLTAGAPIQTALFWTAFEVLFCAGVITAGTTAACAVYVFVRARV